MSDLIELLTAQPSVDGLTTGEILLKQGKEDSMFNRNKLLRQLKPEVAAGRVVVTNAIRTRIDGRPAKVPVYRLA